MDTDRFFRRLRRISTTAFLAGFLLFFGIFVPGPAGTALFALSVLVLLVALLLRSIVIIDAVLRWWSGSPSRNPVVHAPRPYRCPSCGYTLDGVEGVFCPECGAVRPAPLDDDP